MCGKASRDRSMSVPTASSTARAFGPATFITAQPVVTFSTSTLRSVHSHWSHSCSMSEIAAAWPLVVPTRKRSEEHTSELQSLMRISYAVFCLKKKNRDHKQSEQPRKNNNHIENRDEAMPREHRQPPQE